MIAAIVPTIDGVGTPHGVYSNAARAEGVLQVLRRSAEPAGLLLVLEDLHWADPDSLAVLEYLGDNLSTDRVLCLATTRDEPPTPAIALFHRLQVRRAGTHLALSRLDDDQVRVMVRACDPDATADTVRRVQRTADGIPFLVEEALATPGVPALFADGVRARLTALGDEDREVLGAAALLGHRFDWRDLAEIAGLAEDKVERSLRNGVDAQILQMVDGDVVFRHSLTRDAVLAEILPPRRAELAARALARLERSHPGLPGAWTDVAADLAAQAGHRERASRLLVASGRAALERGALATAIDPLSRAAEAIPPSRSRDVDDLLLEALALAGRVDEALQVSERLGPPAGPEVDDAPRRAGLHLMLAQAATAATRWSIAHRHVRLATDIVAGQPPPALQGRIAVLEAELLMADGDHHAARQRAQAALAMRGATPEVRCQALEILGRVERGMDLDEARRVFEQAFATADDAGLAVWRLRALHELGTIDMFEDADSKRLAEARSLATQLGAASTGAVIDLQLAALGLFRFESGEADRHARSALATSTRLGLDKIRATALVFLAEAYALHRDRAEAERHAALAQTAAPGDDEIEGSARAGVDGILALLDGDTDGALHGIGRGVAALDRVATGPAHYLGLWPLLLAASSAPDAPGALDHAHTKGLMVNRINRGFLGYAAAVFAGRARDIERAHKLAREADRNLRPYPVWADIARLYAAEPAIRDQWGQPRTWLTAAADTFQKHDIEPLEKRCRDLLTDPGSTRWAQLGMSARETDVLRLVAEGLSNREIGSRLHISARTAEKHVESLLRKTGARTRTELVARAGPERLT